MTNWYRMDKFYIAASVVRNLEGLRRDMRGNALEYLARLAAGQSLNSIAELIYQNAEQYLLRLEQHAVARDDASIASLIMSGFEPDPSVTQTAINSLFSRLSAVANNEHDTIIDSAERITTLARATLKALPFNL